MEGVLILVLLEVLVERPRGLFVLSRFELEVVEDVLNLRVR